MDDLSKLCISLHHWDQYLLFGLNLLVCYAADKPLDSHYKFRLQGIQVLLFVVIDTPLASRRFAGT